MEALDLMHRGRILRGSWKNSQSCIQISKRPPNALQLVFLESWNLKLEGGDVCKKFPPLRFAPTAK